MNISFELANEIFEDFDEGMNTITIIAPGDWIEDHKYSRRATIVKYQDKFYQIEESRTGSYYTDYHYEDPIVNEVTPEEVVVTKTIWNVVK